MTMKKGLSRISRAVVGDEIFFHHVDTPCCGKVLSVGKHGVTVEHEGKHHRIEWHRMIGHKKRATQRLRILHEGEDGVIVEDQSGKKRFMRMPLEARESQHMGKSVDERRIVLFIKSDSIANRAGLHLENRKDRTGRNQKKWVRNTTDQTVGDKRRKLDDPDPQDKRGSSVGYGTHNIETGNRVQFKLGESAGEGEVVGNPGKDGAHVKDSSGHVHQVRWNQITKHSNNSEPGKQEGISAQSSAGQQDDGKLFDDEYIALLPKTAKQPHDNWEDLIKHGREGLSQFSEMLGKVQQVMGLKSGMKPEDITQDQWENDDGYLFIAPLKSEKRAKEKVEGDYNGDWSQLRDVVRATISVSSMAHVVRAIGHIREVGIEFAQKPKNRFEKPTAEGYRDLMTIIKLPNGMLAELQVHVKAMTLAKELGHKDYEITRTLQGRYGDEGPSDNWSNDDHAAFYQSLSKQKKIYSDAWNKASKSSRSDLRKSFNESKIILLFRKKEAPDDLHRE